MNYLNEAANNPYRASVTGINYVGKRLGKKFVHVDGQFFQNARGKFFGILFIEENGFMAIRLNWSGNTFASISVWKNYRMYKKPEYEILGTDIRVDDASYQQILNAAVEQLGGIIAESSELNEKTYQIDLEDGPHYITSVPGAIKFAIQSGELTDEQIAKALGKKVKDVQYVRDHMDKFRVTETDTPNAKKDPIPANKQAPSIDVEEGIPENIGRTKAVRAAAEELEDTEYADPEVVFQELDDYVTLIAQGVMPALLITGQGGIGKSYSVDKILNAYGTKGEDWVKMKGRCTPSSMYRFLYAHYNQICVFDDCDSIFQTADGMNILKGALDSSDVREISWETSKVVDTFGLETHEEIEMALAEWQASHPNDIAIPSYFRFEGCIIFISNKKKHEIKDKALLTRCTCIDIVLKAEDVISRIATVLPNIKIYKALGSSKEDKDITDEEIKKEVFEFMTSDEFRNNPQVKNKELNFRTFDQIYKYRYAGLPNWKKLALKAGG